MLLSVATAACATSMPSSIPDVLLDDIVLTEMGSACANSEEATYRGGQLIRVSDPIWIITRTQQAIIYESEKAIATMARGGAEDVQAVLASLENINAAIVSDWECYRRSVGNHNFHGFNTGPIGFLRDVALVAYAEAILTYDDTAQADYARDLWVRFSLLIALPEDGRIFHREVPGIIDSQAVRSIFDEPDYTEGQRLLEGIDPSEAQGISEQFPSVILNRNSHSFDRQVYLDGIILNDLLCGQRGQSFLKENYGLDCHIEANGNGSWYEVVNLAQPDDYYGPQSQELYNLSLSLEDARAAYTSEREKWLVEFEAAVPRCLDTLLGVCPLDPSPEVNR